MTCLGVPVPPGFTITTEACNTDLEGSDWIEVLSRFKTIISRQTGRSFPSDPMVQLRMGIEAVFKRWNGKRAVDYRKAAGVADDLGTAVNIVTMVFGNMGEASGTGVAMTRNGSTGEKGWGP